MDKCIVMFSGGLDSRLVVKLMQKRGYDVTVLYVKLPFSKNLEKENKDFCKKHKVKLKVMDYTKGKLLQEYLKQQYIRKLCSLSTKFYNTYCSNSLCMTLSLGN